MAEACRGSDVVGRLGGDEFAAVLTAFEGDGSWALSRLAMAVDSCNQDLVTAPYAVSISMGTAWFDPDDPELLESLLQQADASMYLDKQRRHQLAR